MTEDHRAGDSASASDPVRVIADSPLLRTCDRASLENLRPLLEWVELAEDDDLLLGGVNDTALYFVAEGHLEISLAADGGGPSPHDGQVVARITTGDVVGGLQTLTDGGRREKVRAATRARLVKLAKEGIDHFLAAHPAVAEELGSVLTPRLYRAQMLRVLKEMFGELTQDMLADIEKRVTCAPHPARGDPLLARLSRPSSLHARQRPV